MIKIQTNVFYGPNHYTSFPAVVAEFNVPQIENITKISIQSLWSMIDKTNIWRK